jgi:Tyrosine phosphatase family
VAGPATGDRRLGSDGCCNVRDPGGLPAAGGHVARSCALVRADAVDRLSAAGWAALWVAQPELGGGARGVPSGSLRATAPALYRVARAPGAPGLRCLQSCNRPEVSR